MLDDFYPSMLSALQAVGAVTVRWLPHGEDPQPDETVEHDHSHHGHYSRLAWKPLPPATTNRCKG